ncbi:hypothetical protein JC525_08930 [Alteromonas sp. IB21]|uniref:hypothetical protein n=1 Tax=Alteromonas sp. IB21 TaxID=2779369 RepID=UPI0018E9014E|nr:hypothetical protein [Alteromonas sp. IB21]MBJ2129059.1 hypothetical protein [Alteromonas sp. IB21]
MANPYFTRPASVTSGTVIRSDKYNSDLDTQESAFNALHDRLQHAVFLPETFSGNPNIPEQTVNDTFIYIDTSGDIALYPIATILEQFELVEQRYNQIEAWRAQVAEDALEAQESATLSQRYANEADNVEVENGFYSAKHWANHAEAQIPLVEAAGQAKVDAAQVKVDEAQTKVALAQNYANAAKNVQVETGFYSAKHYSIIAQEQLAIVQAAGQEKVDDAATQVSLATTQAGNATTQANNASASATKADNFANYAHNQFVPNSGGKYSSYHWAKEAEAYAQQTLDTVNGDFVPSTRTVNGKALSSNIIIGTGDIQGLSTVATSGSYTDLLNKPTAADVGAAAASHGHGDYVVKSSNATLNSLTTLGGVVFNGKATIKDDGTDSLLIMPQTLNEYVGITFADSAGTTRWLFYTANNSSGDLSLQGRDDLGDYQHTTFTISRATGDVYFKRDVVFEKPVTIQGGTPHTTANLPNPVQTTDLATVAASGSYNDLSNKPNAASLGAVPTTRTVNGKALSTNITLNASDVGALSSSTTLSTLGGVPTSRQVNGKALTGNITLTSSDVGALPSSQKGQVVTRVSGSFTATRLAGVTEYVTTSTGNTTCTINDSAFAADEKLIIHKQVKSGQLNLVAGQTMYMPNGSGESSHHIPAGVACTVELVFTGGHSLLRIYN